MLFCIATQFAKCIFVTTCDANWKLCLLNLPPVAFFCKHFFLNRLHQTDQGLALDSWVYRQASQMFLNSAHHAYFHHHFRICMITSSFYRDYGKIRRDYGKIHRDYGKSHRVGSTAIYLVCDILCSTQNVAVAGIEL